MELLQICTIENAEVVGVVFPFQIVYTFLWFFAPVIKFSPSPHLVHQKVSLIPLRIAET